MSYIYDEEGKFWKRPADSSFAYSDGDAVEKRMFSILSRAADKSVLSRELIANINDWPTRYHFSSLRTNLLRPHEHLLKGASVLELGGGCGAITRYLGETCGQVTMVEGSARRASIAALRCQGLDNVRIYCDDIMFADLPGAPFDVVTLIGVLEYARVYDKQNNDPIQAMLSRAKSLLSPTGVLILALENQLGLKYFAGDAEDHLGRPMAGINDTYDAHSVVTFGVGEMRSRLERAGFSRLRQYLPLPDYKLPSAVICPEARHLPPEQFDLAALLLENANSFIPPNLSHSFSVEKAWGPVTRNGLAWELCNSLCFVAGTGEGSACDAPEGETLLAVHYSMQRNPQFAKQSCFIQRKDDIVVRRTALHTDVPVLASGLKNTIVEQEPYWPLPKYIDGFYAIVNKKHWTLAQLADWMRPLLQSWEEKSEERNGKKMIPSHMMDCTAKNVMVDAQGKLIFFDQEWSFGDSWIPLSFLAFYNSCICFLALKDVEQPADGIPLGIWNISRLFLKELGIAFSAQDEESFIHWLDRFHTGATGFPSSQTYRRLAIAIRYPIDQLIEYSMSLSRECNTLRSQIKTLEQERNMLKTVVDKYGAKQPQG